MQESGKNVKYKYFGVKFTVPGHPNQYRLHRENIKTGECEMCIYPDNRWMGSGKNVREFFGKSRVLELKDEEVALLDVEDGEFEFF